MREKISLFFGVSGRRLSSSVVGGVGGRAEAVFLGRFMLPFGRFVAFLKQPDMPWIASICFMMPAMFGVEGRCNSLVSLILRLLKFRLPVFIVKKLIWLVTFFLLVGNRKVSHLYLDPLVLLA